MNISIGENIKILRKNMSIGQEILANAVGVSVQAVSKWETGQSLPDVGIIPDIADFFKVSIDSLFFGENAADMKSDQLSLPDDNKLYIVQVRNGKILDRNKWDGNSHVKLAVKNFEGTLNAEIWGNADIKGDVGGNVNAGNGVACGNVGGEINAGGNVNCGDVSGSVSAGNKIRCGEISDCERLSCETLYAKGSIKCGSIKCGGDIHTEENLDEKFD